MKTEQYKSSSGHCMLPPSAYRTPFLHEDYTGSYPELSPPQSAFQQPAPPQTPPSSGPRPLTQKPRSIRRARSGLPAHLQSRSSSEPQEVLRRANSGGELQEAKKQASRQVLSGSPRSTSTIFRPFSPLAAVEVFPEVRTSSPCCSVTAQVLKPECSICIQCLVLEYWQVCLRMQALLKPFAC